MPTSKNRIYFFDLLKFISISIIFVYHIMMDVYVVHPMHNLKFVEDIIARPNMHLAMLAVAIFIMISGATLAYNKREESIIKFYKRRLVKVLIPFYIAYIMCYVLRVYNLRTLHVWGTMPKWRFIFTLMGVDEYLFANGIATYTLSVGEWFLGAIIICYIAFPILMKIEKKFPKITFLAMSAYFILFNLYYDKFHFTIPSHMNVLSQIYNFYLGIVIVNRDIFTKIKKWHIALATLILLIFYFYPKYIMVPDNIKITLSVIAIMCIFYQFENIISKCDFVKKFLTYFNAISLEIFLVHHFVIYQVDYMLHYNRIGGVMTLIVVGVDFVGTITLACLVSYLSKLILKKFNNFTSTISNS